MDIDNKKEAARKKSLGELGELFAIKALADKQFDRIRNVNDNNILEKVKGIEIGKYGKRAEYSDHVPMIIDFNL